MKKAVDSAAKWLTDKAKTNPKLNPIPYAFFKSIINKQVEWAAKRGVTLDFSELAEAVRAELLKSGIYTMADDKRPVQSARKSGTGTGGEFPPLLIKFHSASEAMSMALIFDWLHGLFARADAYKYSGLRISADGTK